MDQGDEPQNGTQEGGAPGSLEQIGRFGAAHGRKFAVANAMGALSYTELDQRIESARLIFAGHGIVPGNRVAIILPSSPAFIAYYLGAHRAGLIVMPLNPLLGAVEVQGILSLMKPALVVLPVTDLPLPAADAARQFLKASLRQTALCVVEDMMGPLLSPSAIDGLNTQTHDPEREALVLFTSGTSGIPKGASHRACNVFSNACESNSLLEIGSDDVVLSPLPFSHTFGQSVIMLGSLIAGAEIAIPASGDADDIMNFMAERGATVLASVPATFVALIERGRANPKLARQAASKLRFVMAGGSPLPDAVSIAFEQLFGIAVHQGYGMTEVACCIALEAPGGKPTGGVGKVFESLNYRIIGSDGESSDIGELQLSGSNIFRGYYTEGGFVAQHQDDWFETGDIVRRADDGSITVFDRKKEMIIRSGYNVYPSEVEAALATHPDVIISAVLPVEDDAVGQEVGAFVVVRPGASVDCEALANWCRDRIARYKYPRLMAIVPDLPRNGSGKILKRALNVTALQRLGS